MPPQPIGGRYRVLEPLARHGAVATFAAEDLWLHRRIGLSLHDGESDLDRVAFERAAEVLAGSWRRGALPLYDLGAEHQQRFVTFELPRATLASSLTRGPGDAGSVRALALALAATIGELHERGAVHGRLHPGAVCLDRTGEPQLALAPVAPAPPGWGGETAWVASEQLRALEPSVEGDVWALGAVLLSVLVGTGPGPLGEAATAELADHLRRSNDPELIALIARCLATEPARRPGSMLAIAGALGASASEDALAVAPPEQEHRVPTAGSVRRRRATSPAVLGAVVACTTLAASLGVVVDHPGDAPAPPTGCSASATVDRTCAAGAAETGAPASTTAASTAAAPKVASGTAATAETAARAATTTTLADAATAATRATTSTGATATAAGAPATVPGTPRTAAAGSTAAAATMSARTGTQGERLRRTGLARRVALRRALLRAKARNRRLRVEQLLARADRLRDARARRRAAGVAVLRRAARWRRLAVLARRRERLRRAPAKRLLALYRPAAQAVPGLQASTARLALACQEPQAGAPGPPWAPRPGSLLLNAPAGGGYVPGRPGQPWCWSGERADGEHPAVA